MKTQFLIAAPSSGSGKTTVARGLMALFAEEGLRVQPFKCGPDYIDTKFHEAVCGRPSVNLDTFMATNRHITQLYAHYSRDADVAIIEGMMGLFDGYDRDRGSSAEIAAVLGLPVVLVVDARSAAYSLAPLLMGFRQFRHGVQLAGVIFNKVGSARHKEMLRQVAQDVGLPCFGCLPKQEAMELQSRYLGLDFSRLPAHRQLAALLREHLDIAALRALQPRNHLENPEIPESKENLENLENPENIENLENLGSPLVARNAESFSFLYQETLDRFRNPLFFDPEEDAAIPSGIALLYLPGGYPEKHLPALAAAEKTRQSIRDYALQGGRIVAECGGMMYLCKEIVTDDGCYPMCGVLPYTITARQADRRLSLGYRRFVLEGREYRGHEFHYTQFLGPAPPSAAQVYNAKGEPVATPVFRWNNVLASYTHLYQI